MPLVFAGLFTLLEDCLRRSAHAWCSARFTTLLDKDEVCVFLWRNEDNVLRDLSHANAWKPTVTAHSHNKRKNKAVQQLCIAKCGARWCVSTPSVDCHVLKFPASEMTSLNKEETLLLQDDFCHKSLLRLDFQSLLLLPV